jgi:predicted metalloprotease
MVPRWLPLLCAAVLGTSCGSSGDPSTAPSSTAGTAAGTTAGTTIESPALQRLPPAPTPAGAPPSSASTSDHEFLTEVFDDVQRLWEREFASAQITYRPARLTIFRHVCAKSPRCTPDPAGSNARSVRVELQADCFAGVWAHSAYQRGELTQTDFEESLRAAAVVGDDFLQHNSTGTVSPESFTHGTSAQRQQWLTTGFERGEPGACDTFRTT